MVSSESLRLAVLSLGLSLSGLLCIAATLDAQELLGAQAVRVSNAGPGGSPLHDATHDGAAYDSHNDRYLVVWDADDQLPGIGATFNGKREIFGRLLGGDGRAFAPEKRLASLGPANQESWDAENPVVAYNSVRREFLTIFVGTVAASGAGDGATVKIELFGQRVSATGDAVGNPRRLTQTGADSNLRLDSREPGMAYNPDRDEYLIVWQREVSDTGSRVEHEIFSQRLDGTGVPVGSAVRVSTMGPNGDTSYDALDPWVTYGRGEYLVVWRGDDNRAPNRQGEFEIFGQRLDAAGREVGPDDFVISQMGRPGDARFTASDPAIAYNPDLDEYLVTWTGLDDLAAGEEVYAQLLRGDGMRLGGERRLSTMGQDGPAAADWVVDETQAAYSPQSGEYFVLWIGEDDRGLLRDGEFEVYGQRLSADGAELGIDDLRISELGPEGDASYDPFSIDLVLNEARNEFLVVYSGDDDRGTLVDDEVEVFARRVAPEIAPCRASADTLCLNQGRFAVTSTWRTRQGQTGTGMARELSGDSGWFWFFDAANTELVVKVLDARGVNGKFWVFYGALSDVEYVLTVTDTQTGEQREYVNGLGSFASRGDTNAFPVSGSAKSVPMQSAAVSFEIETDLGSSTSSAASGTARVCAAATENLCLTGRRFEVEVDWVDPFGNRGRGQAKTLTSDTGWFWFFDPANTELVVKVLDARGVNGRFWVFFGALSNVEYTVTVTDTETGVVRRYRNPQGTFASVGDTDAFAPGPGGP